MKNSVKFIGNAVAATVSTVKDVKAVVLGNEFLPTTEEVKANSTVAVYLVKDVVNFKVAIPTSFTQAKEFKEETLTELEGKKRFCQLMTYAQTVKVALKEALAQEKAAEEQADKEAEEAKVAAFEKAQKAKEEAREQARREQLAKELREAKILAGQKAAEELKALFASVAIGEVVYTANGQCCGKVVEVLESSFKYLIRTQDGKKVVIPLYEAIPEAEWINATFMEVEPKKIVSRNNFKKHIELMAAGGQLSDIQTVKEFCPEFDFSSDRLTGAERNEDGCWVHFANDITPEDNSKKSK